MHTESPLKLSLRSATLLVIASMIGTGIFSTTGILLTHVHSRAFVLLLWLLGGIASLCGALTYAELSAALPRDGGEYHLLSRIYHPAIGFASGWTSFIVGFSAPIAAAAIAFGMYIHAVLPNTSVTFLAALLIVLAAVTQMFGLSIGSRIQDGFTFLKLMLLFGIIAVGLWKTDLHWIPIEIIQLKTNDWCSSNAAVGLILVSFAYSGWNAAIYIAGQAEAPTKNVPIALFAGTAIVTALYLALNAIFLGAAPLVELTGTVEVGHLAASHLLGPTAGNALSIIIALSLVSTVGALIITGSRVYEVMRADYPKLSLRSGARVGKEPWGGIVLQALAALLMVFTSTFDALLTYVSVTLSFFAALTALGVFVLRMREPDLLRPYRVWAYPLTTLIFLALTTWMIVGTVASRPIVALWSFVTVATSILGYACLASRTPTNM